MRKVNVPVGAFTFLFMDNRMFAERASIVGNKVKNREENPLLANELAFSSGKQGGLYD